MYKYLNSFKKPIMYLFEKKCGAEEKERLWEKTRRIYAQFVAETPYIGGKKSVMAHNLYQALALFAAYEAAGRCFDEEDINYLANEAFVSRLKKISVILNVNTLTRGIWKKLIYKFVGVIKKQADEHRGKDWNNTWGIKINPEGHKNGISLTLVGCPIVDFAKKHGYMNMMPFLCKMDHIQMEVLHGTLIRKHTVADGANECDYWILGDKETELI